MRGAEILASYLPQTIVNYLLENIDKDIVQNDDGDILPTRQEFETVVLFADISGFTKLSETMNKKYKERGPEYLSEYLNQYFSLMVKTVASEGGDVFKYAGDAMIVLWPPGAVEDLETTIIRAVQCAIAIQDQLKNANLGEGVVLDVKVGIGVGNISVLHMGGLLHRMEYVAVGEPLTQAFNAEHHAEKGDVNLSKAAWELVSKHFEIEKDFPDGVICLKMGNKVKGVKVKKASVGRIGKGNLDDPKFVEKILCYVPGAIINSMKGDNPIDEVWCSEMRPVSVLFVNLGLKEHDLLSAAVYDAALDKVHKVLVQVQKAVYHFEGSINKFLMDDKGSTLIAIFGLPPVSHEDDPIRASLCAIDIVRRLDSNFKLCASVGVTTGVAFCGVVGSFTRKEYSVLGDSVNLSARLMQHSCSVGGGVVVDSATYMFDHESIEYQTLESITVKGKSGSIPIFRPYPIEYKELGNFPRKGKKSLFDEIFSSQLKKYIYNNRLRPKTVERFNYEGGYVRDSHSIDAGEQSPITRAKNSKSVTACLSVLPLLRQDSLSPKVFHLNHKATGTGSFNSFINPKAFPKVDAISLGIPTYKITTLESISDCYGRHFKINTFSNFKEIHAKLCEIAREEVDGGKLIEMDAFMDQYVFSIGQSEFFLPSNSELSAEWLQTFIDIADPPPQSFKGSDGHILQVLLTKKSQRSLIQSRRNYVRESMLIRKINLIDKNEGSVFVIEGGLGCGKTYLMQEFLSESRDPISIKDPRSLVVYATSSDKFGRHKIMHPFVQLFLEITIRTGSENIKDIISQILQEYANELVPYASLLNDMFDITFESTPAVIALAKNDINTTRRVLMLALFRALGSSESAILIIDEAMFMDSCSWEFALDVATGGKHIMESKPPSKEVSLYFQRNNDILGKPLPFILVYTTRPIVYFLDAILPVVPKSYEALLELPNCDFRKLGRLSDKEMESVISDALMKDVILVSETKSFFITFFQGNPLFALSIIFKLFNMQPSVFVSECATEGPDEGKTFLRLQPTFKLDQITFPATFFKEASFRLDRLPPIQQLILKTVSIMCENVENVWEYIWLENSYPIEKHRARLLMECGQLEDKGITRRAEAGKGKDGERELKYALQNSFMYQECLTRMLQSQKDKLKVAVKLGSDAKDRDKRKKIMEIMEAKGTNIMPNMEGVLVMRKQVNTSNEKSFKKILKMTNEWKKRYIKLQKDSLLVFKEGDDSGKPVQIIFLKGAIVQKLNSSIVNKEKSFEIKCSSWAKKNLGEQQESRQYIFSASETTQNYEDWVYWINYCIEKLSFSSSFGSISTEALKKRSPSSPRPNSNSSSSTDQVSILKILVSKAENLKPRDTMAGTANPYMIVSIGNEIQARTVTIEDSLNPVWSESIILELTLQNIFTGVVDFKIWTKELYSTDDLLAYSKIGIRTLLPKVPDSNKKHVLPLAWYDMGSTGYQVSFTQRVQLEFELTLCEADHTSWLTGNNKPERKSFVPSTTIGSPRNASTRWVNPEAWKVEVKEGEKGKNSDIIKYLENFLFERGRDINFTTHDQIKSLLSLLRRNATQSGNFNGDVQVSDMFNSMDMNAVQRNWITASYGPTALGLTKMTETLMDYMDDDSSDEEEEIDGKAAQRKNQLYYYKDKEDKVQGPFDAVSMHAWNKAGFFKPSLMVRIGEDDKWSRLDCLHDHMLYQSQISWTLKHLHSSEKPESDFRQWEFDVTQLTSEELSNVASIIYDKFAILTKFNVPTANFLKYVDAVRDSMTKNNVTYHNFTHAVDVLQTVYVFLRSMGAGEYMTHLEIFAILVASFCHDLEHPGVNNIYHINTNSELAIRYNDKSVLENFHCAVTFEIAGKYANIFCGLDIAQYRELRAVIIDSILATDMTYHFGLTSELKECMFRFEKNSQRDATSSDVTVGGIRDGKSSNIITNVDRRVIIKTILHSADISNPCKPWEISKFWADALLEEFFNQGDLEKKAGLPVSANMDRDKPSQVELTLSFIDYIVAPLYAGLTMLIPAAKNCCTYLDTNRNTWDTSLLTQIKNKTGLDEAEKAEILKGWERRKAAYSATMNPIIKGDASPHASPLSGKMRRISLIKNKVVKEEKE